MSVRHSFDKLTAVAEDHAAVSPVATEMYLLRVGSMLAFWAEQIAVLTNEVNAASQGYESAYAQAVLDALTQSEKRPTKAEAELHATVSETVQEKQRHLLLAQRDLDFCKRTFTAIEKATGAVKSVVTKQTTELRVLSGTPRGEI